jgi:hypothetical protein
MSDWLQTTKEIEKVREVKSPTVATPKPLETPIKPKVVSPVVETTKPSNHDTVIPRNHDTTNSIDDIRKTVKEFGKEAATYRFTKREKDLLADLVYAYGKEGIRTSENEITRIAINWLINDNKDNKSRVLLV